MKDHVVLRCPVEWEGRIHSAWVESCLQDFYTHRPLLPEDPGPDGGRVSLSVARKPFRVFCALLDQPPSTALRRLIAGYEGELLGPPPPSLTDVLVVPEQQRMSVTGGVERQVPKALPPASLGQRIARASDGTLLDARTGQTLWRSDGRWPETRVDQRGNTSASDSRKQEPFLDIWIRIVFAVLAVVLVLLFALRRPAGLDVGPGPFKAWVPGGE